MIYLTVNWKVNTRRKREKEDFGIHLYKVEIVAMSGG